MSALDNAIDGHDAPSAASVTMSAAARVSSSAMKVMKRHSISDSFTIVSNPLPDVPPRGARLKVIHLLIDTYVATCTLTISTTNLTSTSSNEVGVHYWYHNQHDISKRLRSTPISPGNHHQKCCNCFPPFRLLNVALLLFIECG